MFKLYDFLDSGNGYKIRLMLQMLDIPFELIEKDILKGETRTPDYLAMNPNGRIPLLALEPVRVWCQTQDEDHGVGDDGRKMIEIDFIENLISKL